MRITVNPRLSMAWVLALLIASILLPAGLAVAGGFEAYHPDDPDENTPYMDSLESGAAEASGEGEESEGDTEAGAAEEKKPEEAAPPEQG